MCIGEYPNNITVDINNVTQDTFIVSNTKSEQLQVNILAIVPIAGTFNFCVLLSNNGGEFLLKPTFQFSKNSPFYDRYIVSHI